MSEYEEYNPVEQPTQESEPSVDVTSLKKIDMSVADYDKYADLYPDDSEVVEFYERHDITPGEPIIVSATDPEQPEKNILLVVATGEDSFTTNRSLTNELEARLRDIDEGAERIVPGNDIKELGEHALSAAGIEVPNAARERDGAERTLVEAKNTFKERLDRLSTEHAGISNHYKNGIKTNAEGLSALRNKLKDSSEAALTYLRRGVDQPDRRSQVIALAIEELSGVNRTLDNVLEAVESSRTDSGGLNNQVEAHVASVGGLQGEFRTEAGRIIDEAPELDRATLEQADGEVTEMTIRQTVGADRLKEAVMEIGTALIQVGNDADAMQQRARDLLSRLEKVRVNADYEDIVQSASVLARELRDSTTIRRFAALAEDL